MRNACVTIGVTMSSPCGINEGMGMFCMWVGIGGAAPKRAAMDPGAGTMVGSPPGIGIGIGGRVPKLVAPGSGGRWPGGIGGGGSWPCA